MRSRKITRSSKTMRTSKAAITLILLCVLPALTACFGNTEKSCPAFGSDYADRWSTALNVGDTVTYQSQTGAVRTLQMTSRTDSQPFTAVDEINPQCRLNSVRLYQIDSSELFLRLTLKQITDDPYFYINARTENASEELVLPRVSFILNLSQANRDLFDYEYDPDQVVSESRPRATRYHENFMINGTGYGFAVEQKWVHLAPLVDADSDPASPGAIVRVVVAEGGIIQFEMLNGEVFTVI